MNIHKIQLERPNSLNSDSRNRRSSFITEADESKQTYTAIIFNDAALRSKEDMCNGSSQTLKPRQNYQLKGNSGGIEDLLTVNSLTKMMTKQNDLRSSAKLFVNAKVHNSIDKKVLKFPQRPVSAFTRTNQAVRQCLEIEEGIKECSYNGDINLSLSGKNCLEESGIKIDDKERQSTCNKLEPKMIETPSYGYIAKSRLFSGKQAKRSVHSISKDHPKPNKQLHYDSTVNFESLYKNLLINNKSSKHKDKTRAMKSHYFQKKQKQSFHSCLKVKQNESKKWNKQNSNTLAVTNKERNSIYTSSNSTFIKESQAKSSFLSNSLHKHQSKVSLKTEVLKSMKKGKNKISQMLQLNKETVVEPKLLIQNVEVCRKVMECTSKTSPNTSHIGSQKNITKYLAKLSSTMSKQKNARGRDEDCRLTVQCKKVKYF